MTTPDPLFPELIAELNAPSRDALIEAVRDLVRPLENPDAQQAGLRLVQMFWKHERTIKYCMENGK